MSHQIVKCKQRKFFSSMSSLKKISNVISFGNLFPAILTEKFVAKCFRAKITIRRKRIYYIFGEHCDLHPFDLLDLKYTMRIFRLLNFVDVIH